MAKKATTSSSKTTPPAAQEKPRGTSLSAFSSLRKDQALRQGMEKARKGAVSQDYDGPDADIVCVFSKVGEGEKDGITWRTVEFLVDEEGEFKGKRVSRYFSFADTQYKTKEEIAGDFFQCFIDMGLDTETLTDEELTAALTSFAETKQQFLIRAKRNKNGYMNFYIQEPLGTTGEGDDEAQDSGDTASATAADSETVHPSEWDGMEVGYKTTVKKGPKKVATTLKVWVTNCNDDDNTVDLVDESGTCVAEALDFNSDDIVWPEQ